MISEHQVRERAYFIWKNAGGGSADAHWFQAEAELTRALSSRTAAKAPLAVQPAAEASSLVPSPAKTLPKKASRTKAAAKAGPSVDGAAKSPKPKKPQRGEGASLH